jgi:fructose-1,6-bisphosphatase/inositol monophosphatase family enzyme
VNQATGTRYEAVRGGGARRDGQPIAPSGCAELSAALVGISGFPGSHPGWAQFRAFGAAALEFCSVADGSLDAYAAVGRSTLFGWDYLAGMLVCREVGLATADRGGAEIGVRDTATLGGGDAAVGGAVALRRSALNRGADGPDTGPLHLPTCVQSA